jgi:hypothetical protein
MHMLLVVAFLIVLLIAGIILEKLTWACAFYWLLGLSLCIIAMYAVGLKGNWFYLPGLLVNGLLLIKLGIAHHHVPRPWMGYRFWW